MMNKTYLKYALCRISAVLSGFTGLASCALDEPVAEEVETFTLSLQLNTNGVLTRTADDWEGPYQGVDAGTVFDNTITSVDLFLLGDDSSTLKRLYALKDTSNPAANIYTCEVDEKTPGVTIDKANRTATFTGRLMALANVEDMQSPWNVPENWTGSKIPYTMKFGVSDSWHIPMWGVESYADIILEANKTTTLTDIEMLRAVSKIVIKLDTQTGVNENFRIKAVTMAQGSPEMFGEGYTLPKGAVGVMSTKKVGLTECFDPIRNAATIETPTFEFNSDQNTCWTYVSESLTDSAQPFAFDITLESLKGGQDFKGTMTFANYNNYQLDTPITNVVRNHIYEFTIRLSELTFLTTVKQWEFGGNVHIEM